MKLSRTVVYAVQASLQLAEAQTSSPVPCSRLANDGHMPERFLLQILRSLVTHGILHSTRGVDGGYSLERSPHDISLLDVIEAIDGPLGLVVANGENAEPTMYQLRLRDTLEQVAQNLRSQLQAIKLADLLGGSPRAKLA